MSRPKVHAEGSIREMLVIALPMVVSMGCDTAMIFTDRLFLSKLQPELMNAAMGGGLTSFMLGSFFTGFIGYASALTAQYLGAGRKNECASVITQALIFSLLAYLPILACRPLAHMLFRAMGVLPEQLGPQIMYFDILIWGSAIPLLRISFSSFFSGIGRTGIVMGASLTALVVNAVLNYILIFGKLGLPALGIKGAAYGTLIGGASGMLVLAAAYFSRRNREEFGITAPLRFNPAIAGKFFRYGTSTGLELFLNILAFNIMVIIFHAHGAVTATAATIMLNWDMVSFVPLIGIEIAVTSMVGRFMGAGKPDIAHKAVISGLKLGFVYSLVIFVLFVGCPRQLVLFFKPGVLTGTFIQAVPIAQTMLQLAAVYVLVEAVLIVFIGALRGAGDTFWAMCLSVTLHWLSVLVLVVALKALGLSPVVSWGLLVALFVVFSGLVYLRYKSGHWKTIKVVESPVPQVDGFHELREG